ncbi:hypothetical protein Trydic_g6691 [Trypoxylus dichotomus]
MFISYLALFVQKPVITMRNKCAVAGCESTSKEKKMHRFANPSDYDLCHNHFEPSHYTRNGRLYRWSVPTLNLPISVVKGSDDTEENVFVGMSSVEHPQCGPSSSNVIMRESTSAVIGN